MHANGIPFPPVDLINQRPRDKRIAELIDRVCGRAGGIWDYPSVTDFDRWCEELGLRVEPS